MRNALGKGLDALLGSSFEMEQELNNIAEGKRNIQKISIDHNPSVSFQGYSEPL